MATKGKRPMRALTPGDKIEAIQRVNDGESKASVARDIGVPESTLRGWCKNEDKLRYMTSRISSPENDKSNDGEPPEKHARNGSPVAPPSPAAAGLDLTTPTTASHTPLQPTPPVDAPVELTTKRSEPSPTPLLPRDRRSDPGASAPMSAINPSRLVDLPSLTHPQLGISFNEMATNLSLLAQLNPGLSALSAQPASRALRSVRSPKPAHNGVHNMAETKHRSKPHHYSDPYRPSASKSSHHSTTSAVGNQSVESLWYWLKTQQAMLDLTAQTTTAHQLQLGKSESHTPQPKPIVPATPINSHLDYNHNSWLWQYYKQFSGAMVLPVDKLKSASQVLNVKCSENILYTQLVKGTPGTEHNITRSTAEQVSEPAVSPGIGTENKEPLIDKNRESGRSKTKPRTVLDNLLFNNSQTASKDAKLVDAPHDEWEAGAEEAFEHGEKFLAWLEMCRDPNVTRVQVYQLQGMLQNLRERRLASAEPAGNAAHRK